MPQRRILLGVVTVLAALAVCDLGWKWRASQLYPPIEDKVLVVDAKRSDGSAEFRTVTGADRVIEQMEIVKGLKDLQRTSAAYYLDPYRRDMNRCDEIADESERKVRDLQDRALRLSPTEPNLEAMLSLVRSCMDCTPGVESTQQKCGELYPWLYALK